MLITIQGRLQVHITVNSNFEVIFNMKAFISVLLSICLGQRVVGNIPVNYKVTLSCDHTSPYFTGCLRGMQCVDDGR